MYFVGKSTNNTLYTIAFVITLFAFKNTLRAFEQSLQFVPIIVLVIYIYFLLLILFMKKKVIKKFLYIFVFLCFFLILILFFYFLNILNISNPIFIPFLGFVQYILPVLFWTLIFNIYKNKSKLLEYIIKLILIIGVINAVGGIIQFFFSSNLFGLITNKIYTLSQENITKRAISFISSPQSLGLYIGLCFSLTWFYIKQKVKKFFLLILFLFTGILTGSKIFLLFISVFIILDNIKKPLYIFIFFLIIGSVIFIYGTDNDTIKRFLMISHTISNLDNYRTLLIWINFLTFKTLFWQFLFGHGLGVVSTASQIFYNYKIMNGSAESFLIQLYFETGIVGLTFFLILYIKSISNYLKIKSYKFNKELGYILIALSVSLIGTPAFFGFFTSLIFYFFIIYGFLLNEKKR